MAKGINKWIGIGNCCKDAETRYMPSGGAVTSISIACNNSYKNKETGEKVDTTEFVNITFFNRLAEIAGEYLKKGSLVYIEGRLQTDKYEKNGVTHYSTKIVASEMQMLGSKNDSGAQNQSQAPQSAPAQNQAEDSFDDDLPF